MLFVSAAPSANFLNCESNRYLLPVQSKNVTPSILLRVQPRLPHHNERQRCDIINPAMGRWALYCCIMKLVSCVIRFPLQPDVCQVTRYCTANISVITRHSELTCVMWSPANQRPELAQSDQSEESVRCRKEVADSVEWPGHSPCWIWIRVRPWSLPHRCDHLVNPERPLSHWLHVMSDEALTTYNWSNLIVIQPSPPAIHK